MKGMGFQWMAVGVLVCGNVLAEADEDAFGRELSFAGYDSFLSAIPVVVTPSKMPQPRVNVSSTLSVLDGEFIRRINMQYVEDLLQFVPGFSVAPFKTSSQKIVSYHGTQLDEYRRIQVLVNGRSVYSAGLARVEWATLPLNIEDVARVEVNRGPNAASYGINSFFAVVNIITRTPLETLGSSVSAYSGSRGDYRLFGQQSRLSDEWSYRASASINSVQGFDEDASGRPRHDGYRSVMGNVVIQKDMSNRSFDVDMGASQLRDRIEPSQYVSNRSRSGNYDTNKPMRLVDREHIKLAYRQQVSADHEIKLQYYYDQSDLNEYHEVLLTPEFYNEVFGGVSSVNVNKAYSVDLFETRHDLELQSDWKASQRLRVISSLGYRWDEADSDLYLSGKAGDEVFRGSSNLEYLLGDDWVLNTGAMLERSQMGGTFFSPKLGATYKLSERESVRMNVSQAVRTPDISDQFFRWRYTFTSGEVSTTSYALNGEKSEEITSYEMGYFHYWPSQGVFLDLKFYHDKVQDMVLSKKHFSALFGADKPIQEGVVEDVTIRGAEIELDWRFRSGAMTRFTYAYQDTQTQNASLLESTTPNMMSLFGSVPFADVWAVNGYYFYADKLANKNYQFLNTWLSYRLALGGYSKATLGIGMEARLDKNALVRKHNNLADDRFAYVFTNITF